MKKARNIGYIIISILEVLLILGAYVVQYFTRKKMGMMRFVVYKNMVWEEDYPLELWKTRGIAVLAILTAVVVICWIRKLRNISMREHIMSTVALLLTIFAVVFILTNSVETLKSYYFMAPMIGVGALLQIIKTGVALLMCNTKKDEE